MDVRVLIVACMVLSPIIIVTTMWYLQSIGAINLRQSKESLLQDMRNSQNQTTQNRIADAVEKQANIAQQERTDNTARRWTNFR